jgi:nucleoside-diphosphate-sugar epimerase
VTGPVNIGTGRAIAVRDLVLQFAAALGRRELVELGARSSNPVEPPLVVADVTRLAEEVGYQPRVSLAQAIDYTIAYWKRHG